MDTPEARSANPIILRPADESLVRHGGLVRLSVSEVGCDHPEALGVVDAIVRGAQTFEASIVRLHRATSELARLEADAKEQVPMMREAIFGVAWSTLCTDPAVHSQLPLKTKRTTHEPIYFIDRCLTVLLDEAPRFNNVVENLQALRAWFLKVDKDLGAAKRELKEAAKHYSVSREDFEAAISAGRSYVKKYAAEESEAMARIRYKGGNKPGRKPKGAAGPVASNAATPNAAPASAPVAMATVAPASPGVQPDYANPATVPGAQPLSVTVHLPATIPVVGAAQAWTARAPAGPGSPDGETAIVAPAHVAPAQPARDPTLR